MALPCCRGTAIASVSYSPVAVLVRRQLSSREERVWDCLARSGTIPGSRGARPTCQATEAATYIPV